MEPNSIFYMVTFEGDCSSFFFHSKDKAKEFIWQSYLDDYNYTDEETIIADREQLDKEDFIEDYAWISEEVFED